MFADVAELTSSGPIVAHANILLFENRVVTVNALQKFWKIPELEETYSQREELGSPVILSAHIVHDFT